MASCWLAACTSTSCPEGLTKSGGACLDAGPEVQFLVPPVGFAPWNGKFTGSALATDLSHPDAPLRPRFRWSRVPSESMVVDGEPWSSEREMLLDNTVARFEYEPDGHYQLQVDDDCEVATMNRCAFPSPAIDVTVTGTMYDPEANLEVEREAPVGRRYFWRVRACSDAGQQNCSDWSDPRYVNVGRQATDYNGDGYADVAVGAWFFDEGEWVDVGLAHVFWGGGDGVTGETPSRRSQVNMPEAYQQSSAFFGNSLAAAGDVNGDGYADLLVGASGYDGTVTRVGVAFLFLGGAEGLGTSDMGGPGGPIVLTGPNQANTNWGRTLAGLGDANGDGFDDFAVGSDWFNASATPLSSGALGVYMGGDRDLDSTATLTLSPSLPVAGGNFALSAAGTGDVNGDGLPDLVVSERGHDDEIDDQGRVHVFAASRNNPLFAPLHRLIFGDAVHVAGPMSVAGLGDMDGDGLGDVAVGMPSVERNEAVVSEGQVLIARSRDLARFPGQVDVDFMSTLKVLPPGPSVAASFGITLGAAGDVDGDGLGDLVVGASGLGETDAFRPGGAFLCTGKALRQLDRSSERANNPCLLLDQGAADNNADLGAAVAGVGDVNGDGFDDLAAGADEYGNSEGLVLVYLGGPDAGEEAASAAGDLLGASGDAASGSGSAVAARVRRASLQTITLLDPLRGEAEFGIAIAGFGP